LGVLGVDIFAEQGFRSYSTAGAASVQGDGLSAVRDLLTIPGAVLLTRATADSLGVQRGQSFELISSGRRFTARVAGIIGNRSNEEQLRDLLITDIANAQSWFDRGGFLTRIDVRLDDADDVGRLQANLPPGVELLTADSRTQTSQELTAAFMTNLTAMSLLAMLVGVFLIYNSVGFAVVQRRGLIGVFRALGVTREQTFKLIMAEGAVLGVMGATLGVAAGIWLGEKLLVLVSQSINDLYYRVSVTEVAVGAFSIGKGALAGLGATLIAAAVPAWEAAGYQPSLALRRSALEGRTGRVAPVLLLTGGVVMGVSVFLLYVSGTSLVAGLTALFLLIFGFALCIPVAVKFISGPMARLTGLLGGTPGRMAVDGIRAALSRTGVAIVALAVAVSATIGVSVMVDSFRLAVSDWLGNTLRSDLYVGVESGSLDSGLVEVIAGIDGVLEFSTSRRAWIETEGVRTRVIALSMASGSYAGTQLTDAEPEAVWPLFDAGEGVVVSEPYAYRNRVGRGGSVRLRTDEGIRTL
ncbi:MAG: FtsX-like permease family protein, partial [Pseudomonadota bacterium]